VKYKYERCKVPNRSAASAVHLASMRERFVRSHSMVQNFFGVLRSSRPDGRLRKLKKARKGRCLRSVRSGSWRDQLTVILTMEHIQNHFDCISTRSRQNRNSVVISNYVHTRCRPSQTSHHHLLTSVPYKCYQNYDAQADKLFFYL
jgi:hypothetical protein